MKEVKINSTEAYDKDDVPQHAINTTLEKIDIMREAFKQGKLGYLIVQYVDDTTGEGDGMFFGQHKRIVNGVAKMIDVVNAVGQQLEEGREEVNNEVKH